MFLGYELEGADEKLIRQGELILGLTHLENHEEELNSMNKGKQGPHYRLANSYVKLLATI